MFRQKWVEGIRNSPYSHVILSPRPCSHPVAPPWSPLKLPSSGWAVSPQTAAPSTDGCGEVRPGHVCLQVAIEGGRGPEDVSFVPEP